ncbi:MAG TPA: murein biosynthesis integral membrane protein MurJ [Candidatus Omnitrophota bacterium]|jgi:putative peptidoglycan lipid II flippase|nr:murein biosynthesis integral membrane protein MurJ [Candidatus Omnitrophota bacterium]HPN55560.1 murein biosynthesis integral membrane protein MurJ [Candidatus Omnitrophota bacterium]
MSNDNSGQPDSHGSLIKSTSIISVGTLASRVLGFVRDVILARFFGTGFQADAFFVAFKIPNLFRDFVGEGAANAAVVPVFSEYLIQKNREEFWHFVSVILALALISLTSLTLLGILLAPHIVRLLAPGFMAHPEKLALTIHLTKIMFPYLILIGLTAYSMAVLYAFRSFAVPAFSPCLLNIAIIISALLSSRFLTEPVYGLAAGVLIGGLLQLVMQIRPMLKTGIKIYKPLPLNHPAAIRVGHLLLPRVIGAGVYQLNIFIDTFCASLSTIVGAGGISAIYYSNRIIQFPMGIFGFALASAMLPTLSSLATQNNLAQLKKTLVFILENIFFVMVPFSVVLMLLANPIIRILFQRGEFNQYSTTITSWALLFYAIGLFSFGGIKILVTAFYALQDTKTPVKIAAVCLVINAALNIVLMIPLKVGGIALASSVSASIDFIWLFYCLNKRLGGLNGGFRIFIVKVLAAGVVAGGAVIRIWNTACIPNEMIRLSLAIVLGFMFYGVLCFILRIEQARNIYRWLQNFGMKSRMKT